MAGVGGVSEFEAVAMAQGTMNMGIKKWNGEEAKWERHA